MYKRQHLDSGHKTAAWLSVNLLDRLKKRRIMLMRKCLRCGTEMKENCAIKVEGAGYGIIMSSDENKLFGGRIGKPKVAICPKCGEVSVYVENIGKL